MTELTIYFKKIMPVQHQTTTSQTRDVCKKIRRKGLNEAQVKQDIKNSIQNSYLNKKIRLTRTNGGMLTYWLGAPHRGRGVATFKCTDIEIDLVPTSAGGNNTTKEVPCSSVGVVGANKFNYTGPANTTVTPPQCPPSSLTGINEIFTWGTPSAEDSGTLTGTYIMVQYRVREKYEFDSMYLGTGSYSGSVFRPSAKGPFRCCQRELSNFDKTVNGTAARSNTVPTMCPY